MDLENDNLTVPLWIIWTVILVVAIIAFGVWYSMIDPADTKALGVAGGLLTGLVVYLITFVALVRPLRQLDRIRREGIKALLSARHNKDYYGKLLKHSKFKVDVLGASCSRFVRDFLDPDSDDAILIDALDKSRQLHVRLLIPTDAHMGEEAKATVAATLKRIAILKQRFDGRIELRRFDDEARHSFVFVDQDLVAGPIFDDEKSRHAPAVHVASGTLFGQKYSGYFAGLWDHAEVA